MHLLQGTCSLRTASNGNTIDRQVMWNLHCFLVIWSNCLVPQVIYGWVNWRIPNPDLICQIGWTGWFSYFLSFRGRIQVVLTKSVLMNSLARHLFYSQFNKVFDQLCWYFVPSIYTSREPTANRLLVLCERAVRKRLQEHLFPCAGDCVRQNVEMAAC